MYPKQHSIAQYIILGKYTNSTSCNKVAKCFTTLMPTESRARRASF
ncbi:hypothetical protein PVAP13_8NG295972 [Panicum virgatum]|uniref:Uncharacterized protein n=1 Tax=Panicum virgatum TaxID=38727 RepID=A0A8T0PDU6_PANVG|nr:hypothetical protein PVAP13_8NG295972 [Panicum virgatum]